MSLKVAIVGCGKIADGHVEEIQKLPSLGRVVACCDLEPLMAEQLASRYAIPRYYSDFDQMLERERPDVVHVTTPPGPHLALTTRALEAGCHVYVEKPLTLRHEEAEELVRRVEAAGKKMTIGYTYLFDPPALAMRELIAEGVLGEPVHVESYYGYNLAGPFGKALLGDASHWVHGLPGKLFHNNIDHMLYKMIEHLPDVRPTPLATSATRRAERFGDRRDHMHDELRVLLQGERVTGYGMFSSHARPALHLVRVHGTKNTLEIDYTSRTVTVQSSPKLPSAIGRIVPAFETALAFAREGAKNVVRFAKADYHFFSGLSHLIAAFYRAVGEGAPLPIPYSDMLRISWMMDAIFAQLAQGPAAGEVTS